ncbi:hypothetical protein [Candidatus Protochlamydia phocaeensis]|uniref:hypothetical protein n=1 Tax=Candidatus Protochlamydia phocaeensis TaxID=1414722 RepID=UPI000838DE45|nr:hypothetical protein [Candidatus Protochlamydia phocaeensis]
MLKRILCLGMLIALNTITLHASDDNQSQERSSTNENQLFNDDESKNETNVLFVQSAESDKEGEDKDNSGSNHLACDCEEEIKNRAGECTEEESSKAFAAQDEESKEDSALFLCCKNCE